MIEQKRTWPVAAVAEITGLDAEKLHNYSSGRPGYSKELRSYFTDNAVSRLLYDALCSEDMAPTKDEGLTVKNLAKMYAATPSLLAGRIPFFVGDPHLAYARWIAHISRLPDDCTPTTATAPISSGSSPSTDEALAASSTMPQAILDLLAVVAEQQRQIIALSRRLEAAELAAVHVKVSEHASDHLHRALAGSAKALKELDVAVGEVSVGNVHHTARLAVARSKADNQNDKRDTENGGESGLKLDISAEMQGILKKIAGVGGKFALEQSTASTRVERLTQERQAASQESLEGSFEVEYQGVVIKVGK